MAECSGDAGWGGGEAGDKEAQKNTTYRDDRHIDLIRSRRLDEHKVKVGLLPAPGRQILREKCLRSLIEVCQEFETNLGTTTFKSAS